MKTFYLILSFCMGLFLGYAVFHNESEILKPPLTFTTSSAQTKLKEIDSSKAGGEYNLKRQNDFLRGQLTITDYQLKDSKAKLVAERKHMAGLQSRLPKDSACSNACTTDSLNHSIATIHAITDSLIVDYESRIANTDSTVALRDSQIMICNQAYNQLKDLSKEQAMREQQLTESLNAALKQERKKRMQNRLLAGSMVFLSGIATSLIIYRK